MDFARSEHMLQPNVDRCVLLHIMQEHWENVREFMNCDTIDDDDTKCLGSQHVEIVNALNYFCEFYTMGSCSDSISLCSVFDEFEWNTEITIPFVNMSKDLQKLCNKLYDVIDVEHKTEEAKHTMFKTIGDFIKLDEL